MQARMAWPSRALSEVVTSSMVEPTGYIHLLCGVYAPSMCFEQDELAAMQARDPKSMIRCPECHEATESRSFLPTYKTEPRAAVQS